MYMLLTIHSPRPGAVDALTDSMHRYGAALRTQPGFVATGTFKADDGRLLGLAVFESEQAWNVARMAGRDAVKDDPFDDWETGRPMAISGTET